MLWKDTYVGFLVFSPRRDTHAEHWPRARNLLPAPQYACGSLAAGAECSPRAALRVRVVGRARGMFSRCRNTRADRWPRAQNVLPAPQYACGSLAARAGCSPRAAIRVRIVGRARGMFSPCRNTRADRWPRARKVLPAPQYACGSRKRAPPGFQVGSRGRDAPDPPPFMTK